ncbi:MAG: hypothetical protein ACYTFW_10415 [Planctomycetota bacterium]|jgi:peptidoglycan hydrolase CwlO-like protein
MMKQILILICMIAFGFPIALTGCDNSAEQKAEFESLKAELAGLKAALKRIRSERDDLKARVDVVAQTRDQLQKQVNELTSSHDLLQEQLDKLAGSRDRLQEQHAKLTGSHNQLQGQLAELTGSRNQLQERVDELTKSRNAAVAKAQTAQGRLDKLTAQLQAETEKAREQQDQLIAAIPTDQAGEGIETYRIEVSKGPNIHSFDTSRPRIKAGHSSTLSWQVSKADRIRIEPGIGPVSTLGSRIVKPSTTTTYTLIATNKEGESRETCRVEVSEDPIIRSEVSEDPIIRSQASESPTIRSELSEGPNIHSFDVTPSRIKSRHISILSWQVSNADRIRIEPGIGPVSTLGSRTVASSASITYILIATNETREIRQALRIEVGEHPTIRSFDATRSRILSEKYMDSGDSKVLSGQKPQKDDPNAPSGQLVGYRARKDESGKFIFIPVYEGEKEQ